MGKIEGQAKRHAFPSRRDALQDGLKWRRGQWEEEVGEGRDT